jgi:hypothetical protein
MSEQEFGKKIVGVLDAGIHETMKQSTLYRLQSARLAALEQCQYESESSKIIHSDNGYSVFGKYGGNLDGGKLLLLATILFVLMNLIYLQFWDNDKYSAIDAMILADDLPIDAYIDNEFEQWLDID